MVGVAESSENGTQTVYMDKSFLLERCQGVLQVCRVLGPSRTATRVLPRDHIFLLFRNLSSQFHTSLADAMQLLRQDGG